jgi:hypothetical protein
MEGRLGRLALSNWATRSCMLEVELPDGPPSRRQLISTFNSLGKTIAKLDYNRSTILEHSWDRIYNNATKLSFSATAFNTVIYVAQSPVLILIKTSNDNVIAAYNGDIRDLETLSSKNRRGFLARVGTAGHIKVYPRNQQDGVGALYRENGRLYVLFMG